LNTWVQTYLTIIDGIYALREVLIWGPLSDEADYSWKRYLFLRYGRGNGDVGKLAPESVRNRLLEIPEAHQIILADTPEADVLAEAYQAHGVVGPGSRSDALHVALATMGRVDVLVSWNFKHIVNLGRIRLFNAVNLEQGYGLIEIRTPKEVLSSEKDV
jgi:hypothetical protein